MTAKTLSKTEPVEETSTESLTELITISRSFTAEIQNIMTSEINIGAKSSALGTATKAFAEMVDQIEADA